MYGRGPEDAKLCATLETSPLNARQAAEALGAGAGDFEVLCEGLPPRCFDKLDEATECAAARLRELTEARPREQGASGSVSFTPAEEKNESSVYLSTRLTVTASIS